MQNSTVVPPLTKGSFMRQLTEVPSHSEVAKEGMDLGEMNKILLKKVEELTLHLIRMEKEIETLKSHK